jgi:hypothetical protein
VKADGIAAASSPVGLSIPFFNKLSLRRLPSPTKAMIAKLLPYLLLVELENYNEEVLLSVYICQVIATTYSQLW